jgi:eukaryotic-like serine/threonine-protein kinase
MNSGDLLRNRYRIEKALAKGGFGETYLAIDRDYPGQRQVVVKHLKPAQSDPETLQIAKRLFELEAKVLAELGENSKRIPRLDAHFEENGEFYLVQEFIAGQTLTKELAGRKLPEIETIEILQEALTGLVEVHSKNKIHRDLKPDNIIRRATDGKLVLIDFGAVKEVRRATNKGKNVPLSATIGIGTQGYTPGEQWRGNPKPASDVYAVGAIGIQCLTGKEPGDLFDDDIGAFRWQYLCQVDRGLILILEKMVAEKLNDRYRDATEALRAIEQLLATQKAPSQPKTTTVPTSPSSPPKTPRPPIQQPAPQNPTVKAPAKPNSNPGGASRRQMLKFLGFGGSGMMGVFLIAQLFNRQSLTTENTAPDSSSSDKPQTAQKDTENNLHKISFTSVRVDKSGTIIDRPKGSAMAFEEDLGGRVAMTMVKIPAGKFMIGSPVSEKERSAGQESPQYLVMIPEFYLSQTLVTQAQWQVLMENNPSKFKGNIKLPVDSVSWLDAMDFCQKLSQKTGRIYRLPSEAEWEYTCRAGTTTPFAFGETITPEIVNYDGNYTDGGASNGEKQKKTTIVGNFPANTFGLYDMHGNLYEWCLDEWSNNYNNPPTDGSARGDINSRDNDKHRLLRGGSWNNNARNCCSADRNNNTASYRDMFVGLRVLSGAASTPNCQNF